MCNTQWINDSFISVVTPNHNISYFSGSCLFMKRRASHFVIGWISYLQDKNITTNHKFEKFQGINNMYTQSPSYTTLYFVISFFLGNRFWSTRPSSGPFFLLKAHITSNKMYALQLKIIRSQRYNIACDTITYYGIPFTLEKCFFF